MRFRRIYLLICSMFLLFSTTSSTCANLWIVSGINHGYTAVGGTRCVSFACTIPDDPEIGQEYQKDGPFYEWSAINITTDYAKASVSSDGNQAIVSVTSSTAGSIDVWVFGNGYRLKRLNDNEEWIRYSEQLDVYLLTVNFVDVTVTVRQYGSSDSFDSSVAIGVGHIESAVHMADVQITASIACTVEVPVTLSGGNGHNLHAVLSMSIFDIEPEETVYIRTYNDGTISGSLVSSNVSNSATITAGQSSATVDFEWSNYLEDDRWVLDPPYIVPGGTSDISLMLKHNDLPMDGHVIRFFVTEVQYYDENGELQTLVNIPESPLDLSAWAYFDPAQETTDENGWMTATLHFVEDYSVVWIGFDGYDMAAYSE